ncbi:MAG: DUF4160 domain-containing protein [Armatimonadetes bacterium]|nr:DUF4160 domain-containing protein [Armatimonadota bacterium]
MPEISRFYGLVIAMYYNDPLPPHFHVRYGEQQAIIGLDRPAIPEGPLTARAAGLAIERAVLNTEARREALQPVTPLD